MFLGSTHKVIKAVALPALIAMTLTAYAQRGTASDAQIQADAQKQLHGKQFHDVQVQVANGVVTLTGHVDRLADKLDAEKRIDKMHEAASINHQISVNTTENVSDEQLYQKLGKQLAYDREGY